MCGKARGPHEESFVSVTPITFADQSGDPVEHLDVATCGPCYYNLRGNLIAPLAKWQWDHQGGKLPVHPRAQRLYERAEAAYQLRRQRAAAAPRKRRRWFGG